MLSAFAMLITGFSINDKDLGPAGVLPVARGDGGPILQGGLAWVFPLSTSGLIPHGGGLPDFSRFSRRDLAEVLGTWDIIVDRVVDPAARDLLRTSSPAPSLRGSKISSGGRLGRITTSRPAPTTYAPVQNSTAFAEHDVAFLNPAARDGPANAYALRMPLGSPPFLTDRAFRRGETTYSILPGHSKLPPSRTAARQKALVPQRAAGPPLLQLGGSFSSSSCFLFSDLSPGGFGLATALSPPVCRSLVLSCKAWHVTGSHSSEASYQAARLLLALVLAVCIPGTDQSVRTLRQPSRLRRSFRTISTRLLLSPDKFPDVEPLSEGPRVPLVTSRTWQ